jgi:signal transduction histidine kinase
MKTVFFLPIFRFVGVTLVAFLIFTVAAVFVTNRPHIDVPAGAELRSVNGIDIIPTDTIEEPDQLNSFVKMRAFFERQTQFAAQLDAQTVLVQFETPDGVQTEELRPIRSRMLSDLPFVFWFQNAVGLLAMIVAGWVFALRRDAGVIALVVLSFGLQLSAAAASVYGARQLALPGDLFVQLSNANHLGAAIFGTALVCMFMLFPRRIVSLGWVSVPVVVFGLFHLSDTFSWTENLLFPVAVLCQLLTAFVFGVIQFRRSRHEPVDRAGLRWFLLSTFLGCILFTLLSVAPTAFGISELAVVSQGYAFGFFSFMQVGLALGVSRFRLFALDRFSYQIWLWIGSAILILAIDALLLFWLHAQPWASLAAAMFIGSFLYFPLRQLLVNRFVTPRAASIVGKVTEVVSVGLAPTRNARADKWDDLLHSIFEPASQIETLDISPDHPQLSENGLALEIPGTKDLKGRRLRYAAMGRRLFNSSDLEVVGTLSQIHTVVFERREAFETGVNQERERIARDVHDNIGAQLLGALHTPQENRKDALLRDTLADLRTIVNEGFQSSFPLWDILMDLRIEMADRVELQGITLDWPINDMAMLQSPVVPYMTINTMRSIMREVTSNALKYALPQAISVRVAVMDGTLTLNIWDDGSGFDEVATNAGNGLENIKNRTEALGGTCKLTTSVSGTRFDIALPLDRVMATPSLIGEVGIA